MMACWNCEGKGFMACSVCGLYLDDDAQAENPWRARWISLACSALLAGGFLLLCVLIALAIAGVL
jgi:hypothetical protein